MPSLRSLGTLALTVGLVLAGGRGLGAQSSGSERPVAPDRGSEPTDVVGLQGTSEMVDEQRFVDLINELRADKGLGTLTVHPVLVPLARDWAANLRSQGSLSHSPDLSTGVDLAWTRLGENVGVGPIDQLQALFDAFVASPAHYANLVKPDYDYVGIGVVYGDDGRIWTAHRFMALDERAAPPPAPAAPAPTAPAATAPTTTATTAPTTAAPTTSPAPAGPTGVPTTSAPGAPTPPRSPAFIERLSRELADAGL